MKNVREVIIREAGGGRRFGTGFDTLKKKNYKILRKKDKQHEILPLRAHSISKIQLIKMKTHTFRILRNSSITL